jgi:hypothetical protein
MSSFPRGASHPPRLGSLDRTQNPAGRPISQSPEPLAIEGMGGAFLYRLLTGPASANRAVGRPDSADLDRSRKSRTGQSRAKALCLSGSGTTRRLAMNLRSPGATARRQFGWHLSELEGRSCLHSGSSARVIPDYLSPEHDVDSREHPLQLAPAVRLALNGPGTRKRGRGERHPGRPRAHGATLYIQVSYNANS